MGFTLTKDDRDVAVVRAEGQLIVSNRAQLKDLMQEALDQGEGTLFLVFADRTSGHGSYGAGRFIDAPMPDAQGQLVVDFNRAYNPPCAFTPFATCPLPPPENRLDLRVEAGEKTYRKPETSNEDA